MNILTAGSRQDRGENARMSNFVGAIAVSDLMKTTLGPRGMDKVLHSMSHPDEIQVTNDGATILRAMYVDNPAAKVLIDISKTQDEEVGDGTTSVCVFAGELLREGERLFNDRMHPMTIIRGYRRARQVALQALEASAKDNAADAALFREDLLNIARTTISSKILRQCKEKFAQLAVDAVLRLNGSTDLDRVSIIKKVGGSLDKSYLDDGFILEKSFGVGQPKRIEGAKVLLANTSMDNDKIKIYTARVKVSSTAEVAQIEEAERAKMLAKCQKIVDHGCNVFINRQLIYNLPEQFFADKGVAAIEHADFAGVERLAFVLGAEITSTFDFPGKVKLGTADLVEEIIIGEDRLIRFSGCGSGAACSVVLRASSQHALDEAERSLHDALCVLSQTVASSKVVLGAGTSEMLMAEAVEAEAKVTAGKEALAMQSWAAAARRIPFVLADNAGLDATALLAQLRAEHVKGHSTAGLNIDEGTVGDSEEQGIKESWKVKSQVVISATEAAEMILRVDDILRAAPRERQRDPRLG